MSKLKVVPFSSNRRVPRGRTGGIRGLVDWVRKAHPAAYANLARTRPGLVDQVARLDGLGDTSGIADKANQIAAAVLPFLQLDAQRRLLKAQVERAKRGEPPIDASQLQLPAARVEFDAGEKLGSMMKVAGIGLGLVFAGMLLFGRRR